jgi:hypothetical protein
METKSSFLANSLAKVTQDDTQRNKCETVCSRKWRGDFEAGEPPFLHKLMIIFLISVL